MPQQSFLEGFQLRPLTLPGSIPFKPLGLALGGGAAGLEGMVSTCPGSG